MIGNVEHTRHLRIRAVGRDERGLTYFWFVVESGSRCSDVIVPLTDISHLKPAIENELLIVSPAARAELQRRVQACAHRSATFSVRTKAGWCDNRFVFPDGTMIGKSDGDPLVRLPEAHMDFASKFSARGEMDAWDEVALLARGNTRLILAVGLALTGPIVDWLGLEAPAFQLTDPRTGVGKSTIAEVAGSVWGGRANGQYAEGWGHTPNYIEKCAKAHHAAFLVLDDLRTFKFSTHHFAGLDEVLMSFANGYSRGRLTDAGPAMQFRTPLLSTANTDLISTAARLGAVVDDALLVRLIDVPLPQGVRGAYENLHGRQSHAEFSIELRRLAHEAAGQPSVVFVRGLERMRARDDQEAERYVRNERERCIRLLNQRTSLRGRDLSRFFGRFATVYGTLATAIRVEAVYWSHRETFEAVLACAEAHVELVSRARSCAERPALSLNPLERLRRYHAENCNRFVDARRPIADPTHDHDACVGYTGAQEGHPEVFFAEARWRHICGPAAAAAKETLRQSDMLNATAARPSTRRVLRIAGRAKRVQVIAVKAAFFEGRANPAPQGSACERALP